jgi:hypothetical protein
MTNDQDDNVRETTSFKIADRKIESLLRRLEEKNVCPCCTARALAFHAGELAEHSMGIAEAAEMFEDIAASMRERDTPAPARSPSMATH